VKAGDKLLVVTQGDGVIVLKRPKAYYKAIRGIAKDLYPDSYLDKERADWK
jgi:hypothetical protein